MLVHLFNSTLVSGPETLVIPALPALRMPVTVVFLSERRKEAESRKPIEYARCFGLSVREVWVKSRYDREAIAALSSVLVELKADIVHAHDVKASVYALAATQRARRQAPGGAAWRLISTHHGVRARSGALVKTYEWYYSRFVLPRFDQVLLVCSADKERLLARGVPSRSIRIHLNGVDRVAVPPSAREMERGRIRAAWKQLHPALDDGSLLIGFVGRLSPEKQPLRVLRVLDQLRRRHPRLPRWRLVAFGKGPLEAALPAATRALDLENHVLWMGYRSGLGNELAGFDVLLSLSTAEGLPINLVEAGWAGTPVLATRVDGNPDLIPSDELGTLVEVSDDDSAIADQLAALLADKRRRETIGNSFQEHVMARFSGKRWREELEEIYAEARAEP